MRLVRTGLMVAVLCQGIYWLGVLLRQQEEPLSLLGMVLSQGYGWALWGMTAVGLLVAAWGLATARRERRRAG